MSVKTEEVRLGDGTVIRHKVLGYEGRIDGTTGIKACFTAAGELLGSFNTKQTFQYRVFIDGESMRRIAPEEDLEILERITGVVCPSCRFSFQSRPGCTNRPGGRCTCGGWICPSCLACQEVTQDPRCQKQQKRLARKVLKKKPR